MGPEELELEKRLWKEAAVMTERGGGRAGRSCGPGGHYACP